MKPYWNQIWTPEKWERAQAMRAADYHDTSIAKENELRAPGRWLAGVRSPLFVLEGAARGNLQDLKAMKAANSNPLIRFLPVPNKDHFSILAPANELIAERLTTKPALPANELLSDTDAGTISGR